MLRERRFFHVVSGILALMWVAPMVLAQSAETLQSVNLTDQKPVNKVVPSVPLPEDFVAQIQGSALTASFSGTFAAYGVTLDYANGIELFPTNLPPAAEGARIAMVPLVDSGGSGQAVYNYTYNPDTGIEGADASIVLQGNGTNTLRVYVDPTLTTYVDMVIDGDGTLVSGGGVGFCPVELSVANDSLETKGCYWQCVLDELTRAALLGMNTGLTDACVTFCSAGGLANPGCQACVAGAVVVAVGIWWDCY